MLPQGILTVLAMGLACGCQAFNATILADTNRDGQIDHLDVDAKQQWTRERGALFLANVADTDGRCTKLLVHPPDPYEGANGTTNGTASLTASGDEYDIKIESYLDACHDATDNVLRNAMYLAPLRTLPIRKGLDEQATATIHVTDEEAATKCRVFVKDYEGSWQYVAANHTFNAADIKKGLELGIDARDIRRPTWNGSVQVHFTVRSAKTEISDHVALRVAPVLTHHHAQLAERAFTTAAKRNDSQVQYVSDFQENVLAAGIDEPVFLFTYDDIWTQDFFEPGYTSIPGPDGPIVLRVMIRSTQSRRLAGRQVFSSLRSSTVGAVQHLGLGRSIDSTGNLETVPPHTFRNVSYPAGRVIMGSFASEKPLMLAFLEAQETQKPIELDTDWLSVGHVDEFLQFLPTDNARGWVLMVDDPMAGLEILEAAAKTHGSEKAVSRPRLAGEPDDLCLPQESINDVLKFKKITEVNRYIAGRIQYNIDILKRETGLTDEDIVRVPALFENEHTGSWTCADNSPGSSDPQLVAKDRIVGGPAMKAKSIIEAAGGRSKRSRLQQRDDSGNGLTAPAGALYPGTINGVVLTDSLVLAPNPWGPVINGVDILAQAVEEAYARVKYNVTFQDDWFSHHQRGGEVHCGSNTWRQADTIWWADN